MGLTETARELFGKIEVLRDLEGMVRELMAAHEKKRDLWFPSDFLSPAEGEDPEAFRQTLRGRAAGIPDAARAALAVNLLTEEGLPHFHRLLAVYLGDESHWRVWNNLWTAEEDRHGQVLHDYARDTGILHQPTLERLQFDYLKAGFHPEWDRDPYRVFAYTTLQERATQYSHAGTGRVIGNYEPALAEILDRVAMEEARHFSFYRSVFEAVLARDPNGALASLAQVMPGIDMPGHTIPRFTELADVIRRSGIYGPRDYLRIVEEQIRFWKLEALSGLDEIGRAAQEKILAIPDRIRRVAEVLETRTRAKTFSFDVVFGREFALP